MNLEGAEPQAGPWRILSLVELTALLVDVSAPAVDRPRIVAVDGRSASGKTTLARRLNGLVPRSAVFTPTTSPGHTTLTRRQWSRIASDDTVA